MGETVKMRELSRRRVNGILNYISLIAATGIIYNTYAIMIQRDLRLVDARNSLNHQMINEAIYVRDKNTTENLKILIPFYFAFNNLYEGIPRI